ncbi:hypothetical protein [Chloroflexus sp.]|uniref:hypothetical protein n=1 Tax=Chloroflexus sp. TaxID=1904827 RepID=UPI002630B780|nr:hypothetical protein [uncultured Chloroflexus sp.]
MRINLRQTMQRWWLVGWPLFWFFALTVFWTWPLVFNLTTVVPGHGVDPLFQMWTLAWDAHALLNHPTRVWDAPIFFPYATTLAYSDHHLPLALLMLPILACGQVVLAYNLLVMLSFALSGWSVFLLTRNLLIEDTGKSAATLGALLAGSLFAFSTYRMAHIGHLQMLQMAWLPLALFWLRQMSARSGGAFWRAALLTGLFAGLQAITAIYYAPMAALALGLAAVIWLWPKRIRSVAGWRELRRYLAGLALAGGLAATITLPLLWPYMHVYRYIGVIRSIIELDKWSAPLEAYRAVPVDNLWHRISGELVVASGGSGELKLFPGLIAAVIALVGAHWLIRQRMWRTALVFGAMVATGFVFSLGVGLRLAFDGELIASPLPYVWLYEHVPGFNSLRVPARWWMMGSLALAVLAGIGAAVWWQRWRAWRWLWPAIATIALLEHLVWPMPQITIPSPPPVYQWLAQTDSLQHRVALELPVDAKLRSDQIAWRQFFQIYHWRSLVTGYSGIFPHGSLELARQLQRLPDDGTLSLIAKLGIDTLIIHQDNFSDPAEVQRLVAWADQNVLLERKAKIGEAVVYAIKPVLTLPSNISGATLYLSANSRIPGMLALSFARRWQEAGGIVYGPQRPSFYPALAEPQAGQVFDYVALAINEDPLPFGADPTAVIWQDSRLAIYKVANSLIATFEPGVPEPGQYHPRHPATLTVVILGDSIVIDRARFALPEWLEQATLALDVASLEEQDIRINGELHRVSAGGQRLVMTIRRDQPVTIDGDPAIFSIARLQLWRDTPNQMHATGVAICIDSALSGAQLSIAGRISGADQIILEILGAEAGTERPVSLVRGTIAVANGGSVNAIIDLLQPEAEWLEQVNDAVDGRYIAYVKPLAAADGIPIAQFQVRNGQIVAAQALPIPLTVLTGVRY